MELLLNLIWLTLGIGAFLIFQHRQPHSCRERLPYRRGLLALACALLLLFPIVSASDDLHPTQALLEDATRRIQHFASPLQISHNSHAPMLLLLVTLCLWFALTVQQKRQPVQSKTHALSGYCLRARGRAPPIGGN
jgi:hypothetical protein